MDNDFIHENVITWVVPSDPIRCDKDAGGSTGPVNMMKGTGHARCPIRQSGAKVIR